MKHLNRSWNSLTDLKDYLEKNNIEKVKYFDGGLLKTDQGNYYLAFNKLRFVKKQNA